MSIFGKIMRYVVTTFAVIIFILIAVHIFSIFRDKDIPGKSLGLQEADKNIDVLFFGSSHTQIIVPLELWKEHGIVSYNMYNDGNSMERNLATLKLALEYTTPKLIVVDVDGWWKTTDFYEEPGTYHYALDNFPFSIAKFHVVKELTDDKKVQKELLFDFYRYHSRWQELKKEDFLPQDDVCMGASLICGVKAQSAPQIVPKDAVYVDEDSDPTQLIRIIEECRSRNIDVMFVCIPYGASAREQMRYHSLNAIMEQYGVTYINFFNQESYINYACDFADKGHLNILGGMKIGNVLADIMKKQFLIPDRRQDVSYADWNQKEQEYDQLLYRKAENLSGLEETLLVLGKKEFCGEVYLDMASGVSKETEALLTGILGKDTDLVKLREALKRKTTYLLVFNRKENIVREYIGAEADGLIGELDEDTKALVCIRKSETLDIISEKQY